MTFFPVFCLSGRQNTGKKSVASCKPLAI